MYEDDDDGYDGDDGDDDDDDLHRVFPPMCFEGNWLQNRLRAEKNESRSLLVVDIHGHQRGGFCIVPMVMMMM